ncbi:hypothetical protein EC957_006707 [Mortierella hygrophila]|uniref:Extracellular membrane protein CFEM domain-containing protein n=1 Tax=Mortierella hygrophila TaxID=979708 RepID=A0A9P6EYW5_9FUNG|nr:hypothetical protein EC957_006707 [Mortierella hygrophila]
MQFFKALALLATTLSLVLAQDASTDSGPTPCMLCLQDSLQSLSACTTVKVVIGEMEPASDPAYAACLCSSLDGAWIDKCTSTCSQDVLSFKNAYAENIQAAGLSCGAQPTFVPASFA